jgi:hypothetical protein
VTFNIPPGALSAGSHTFNASYTPDSASSLIYGNASGAASSAVVVSMAVPAVTVTLGATSITTADTLSGTVTVSGGTGNPAPTGDVTLTAGSYTSKAGALNGGTVTFNISSGALNAGSHTFNASYTPDTASSLIYDNASGAASSPVVVSTATSPVTPQPAPQPAAPASSTAIAGTTGRKSISTQAGNSNLMMILSRSSGDALTWDDIDSIDVNVGDPCGETSSCSDPISSNTPGIGTTGDGVYYPLKVATGKTLKIDQKVNFSGNAGSAKAFPVYTRVDCNQSATASSFLTPPAASEDQEFTDFMVQGSWCDEGERAGDDRELNFSEATATLLRDANGALPAKSAQPIRGTVNRDVAIFRLEKRATYKVAARIRGEEAVACNDTGTFTVTTQSAAQMLKVAFTQALKTLLLIFVDGSGQLAYPGSVFEKSQGSIPVGSNGICTLYPKDGREVSIFSQDARFYPDTFRMPAGKHAEVVVHKVRFERVAESASKLQKLEEEFFLLDGLLAGALIEVLDAEEAKIATLTAGANGTCRFPITEEGQIRNFVYKVNGREVERVRLRAGKQATLQGAG